MFAGHVGAALVIGRVERRVGVGVFIAASMLLDLLLWLFILLGWESVHIPADFDSTHQPAFEFPLSHGLLASLGWGMLAAVAAWTHHGRLGAARLRAAVLVGMAVVSHWLLDALVHRPELPIGGSASPVVGIGLWDNMPLALSVEAALLVFGMLAFIPGSGLSRGRTIAFALVCLTLLAFTVAGMTVAPPPPSALAMAGSSLATLLVLCALMAWLGKVPR